MATRNGAQSLGIQDQVGTIEEGKQASLVVLGANPLEDVSNTRKIKWTDHAGHFISPKYTPPQKDVFFNK